MVFFNKFKFLEFIKILNGSFVSAPLIILRKSESIFGLVKSDQNESSKKNIYGYNIVCSDAEIETMCKENKDISGYILGIGIGIDGSLNLRHSIYDKLDKIFKCISNSSVKSFNFLLSVLQSFFINSKYLSIISPFLFTNFLNTKSAAWTEFVPS